VKASTRVQFVPSMTGEFGSALSLRHAQLRKRKARSDTLPACVPLL
jgi:hypothetical protein